jgi:predicted ATPase
MNRFVIITGCSGGGKSALLAELSRRGYAVVEEPGRRIVREELDKGGSALPWVDAVAFARRAVEMSLADLAAANGATGWVFFDRGLIDAESALRELTGQRPFGASQDARRYHRQVFLAPPWREIYRQDPERRHGYDDAVAEFERLARAYPSLGYEVALLPKAPVDARADFVIAQLATPGKASNLDIDMMDGAIRMHQNRRVILPERKADS